MLLPWSKKLGRKLALFHWSSPITSLPPDHGSFTDDPQVNFSSLSSGPAGDISALPSTVQIVDLELQDPPTDDETTMTMTQTKLLLYHASKLIHYHACKLRVYPAHRRLMKRAGVRLAKLSHNRR